MSNDSKVGQGWANAVAYFNSYKTMDPAARSTGFRTNDLRYRTLSHGCDPRIGEDFLLNTRLRRGDWASESSIASYFSDPAILMLSMRGRGQPAGGGGPSKEVALPPPVALSLDLSDALSRRRSSRLYTGDSMPLNYLSSLLRAAGGISGSGEASLSSGGQATLQFRVHASAGGLYPIDIYLLPLAVEGLERLVYRFDPFGSRLIQTGDERDVEAALRGFAVSADSISIRRANLVFFLVAQPWRSMRKYGPRGMRFVFVEAGAIAQNLHLATVALGFGSVECASTYEDEIHEALQIDGLFETLVGCVIVGYPG